MRSWKERTVEERCLLAPSFIGSLLWAGARGAAEKGGAGLRFEYAFLLAPLVLHKRTRDRLPLNVTTSGTPPLRGSALTLALGAALPALLKRMRLSRPSTMFM